MTYAVPEFTSFMSLFAYANTATGQLFGIGLLATFFLITFISLKSFETEKAFTAAAFVTVVLAILLHAAGILPLIAVIVPVAMLLIGVVIL